MKQVSVREAFEKMKPEGCAFVISSKPDGKATGMVVGWCMKCSAEPARYAISLSKRGFTHKCIHRSGEFVVAVPNKGLVKELNFFGNTHGNETDKFKESGIVTIKARKVNLPLIKKATINLECKVEQEIDSGDHVIFIGSVVAAHMDRKKKVLMNMKQVNGKRYYKEF